MEHQAHRPQGNPGGSKSQMAGAETAGVGRKGMGPEAASVRTPIRRTVLGATKTGVDRPIYTSDDQPAAKKGGILVSGGNEMFPFKTFGISPAEKNTSKARIRSKLTALNQKQAQSPFKKLARVGLAREC